MPPVQTWGATGDQSEPFLAAVTWLQARPRYTPCSTTAVTLKCVALAVVISLCHARTAGAQQAVSSITQSRLFSSAPPPTGSAMTQNADSDGAGTISADDSFGAQIVLKNDKRPPTVDIFSNASVYYTNNVDLTPNHTRSDVFVIGNVAAAWRPIISPTLAGDISASASIFRYDRATELDFERVGAAAGLSWVVPHACGIVAFGRYDFSEVVNTAGHELLQDHQFTAGGQKSFVLGRSHFLTAGVSGVIGRSVPRSQERDQGAVYGGYHLQITRSVDADAFYRYAAQFYEGDRLDHNQTVSLVLGYYGGRWLRFEGSVSVARNDSSQRVSGYDGINLGSGVKLDIRF